MNMWFSLCIGISCLVLQALGLRTFGIRKECKIVDWTQYRTELNAFNQGVVKRISSHSRFEQMFQQIGTTTVMVNETKPMSKVRKIGKYEFNIQYQFNNFNITGLQNMQIQPIKVLKKNRLAVNVSFNGDLKVVVHSSFNFTQLTQSGCKENEERYKSKCYRKCSLLTNMEYPKRTGKNRCSKLICADGMHLSHHNFRCYAQPCPKDYFDQGDSCIGNCTALFGHQFTKSRFFSKCVSVNGTAKSIDQPKTERENSVELFSIVNGTFPCFGFNVNHDSKCPTSFYKWCFTKMHALQFRAAPGQCREFLTSPKLSFNFTQPSIVMELDLDVLDSDAGTPVQFLNAIFGNQQEKMKETSKKAVLSNIVYANVEKVTYGLVRANDISLDYISTEVGYPAAMFEYMTDYTRYSLNHDTRMHDKLMRRLSTTTRLLLNSNIKSQLHDYFNKDCLIDHNSSNNTTLSTR